MAATTIDDRQRRARLVTRHRLTPTLRAGDPVAVADAVVALHATDPATVHLAVAARTDGVRPDDIAAALYDDRTLVRTLAMRRTMFVVTRALLPVLQASSSVAVASTVRRALVKDLDAAGVDADPAGWLATTEEATVTALAAAGGATGAELAKVVPALATTLTYAEGKAYGATVAITSRVLVLLGLEGRIVRGRPRGSWISSQYQWATVERWLDSPIDAISVDDARRLLVERWLRAFGPGTIADLRWWTGWTAAAVKAALAGLAVADVAVDGGGTALVVADDLEPVIQPVPAAALLPALDPTTMGWKERSWYLGDHGPALFDTNGNAGPTVWWDGRVVGGWAHHPADGVVVRLLEDIGREGAVAVAAEAARLTAWIGPTRVIPRFRTPLERALVAGPG